MPLIFLNIIFRIIFTLTPASICGPLMISYCSTFNRNLKALFGPRTIEILQELEFGVYASSRYSLLEETLVYLNFNITLHLIL